MLLGFTTHTSTAPLQQKKHERIISSRRYHQWSKRIGYKRIKRISLSFYIRLNIRLYPPHFSWISTFSLSPSESWSFYNILVCILDPWGGSLSSTATPTHQIYQLRCWCGNRRSVSSLPIVTWHGFRRWYQQLNQYIDAVVSDTLKLEEKTIYLQEVGVHIHKGSGDPLVTLVVMTTRPLHLSLQAHGWSPNHNSPP